MLAFEDVVGGLTLRVPLGEIGASPRQFYQVFEHLGLSTEDYSDEEVTEEFAGAGYSLRVSSLPRELPVGERFSVEFQVIDLSTGLPVDGGYVTVDLLEPDGSAPAFAYSVAPPELVISKGAVSAELTITAANPLENQRLAVTGYTTSSPRARDASDPGTFEAGGFLAVIPDDDDTASYIHDRGSFTHPLGDAGSNPFTNRVSGGYGEFRTMRPHVGIDYAAAAGTPVYAVGDGVVAWINAAVDSDATNPENKVMVVNHGNGYASSYWHVRPLESLSNLVREGELIAVVGVTAQNHLHFEMRSTSWPFSSLFTKGGGGATTGNGFNPANFNPAFTPDLISRENKPSTPEILRHWAVSGSPHEDDRGGQVYHVQPFVEEESDFILVQVSDRNPRTGGLSSVVESNTSTYYSLPPYAVNCEIPNAQGDGAQSIDLRLSADDGPDAVSNLFQGMAGTFDDRGYPRMRNGMPKPLHYLYWFKWDTVALGYKEHPYGPRSIHFDALDATERSNSKTLTFGPRLSGLPATRVISEGAPEAMTFTVSSFLGGGDFEFARGAGTDSVSVEVEVVGSGWSANFPGAGTTTTVPITDHGGSRDLTLIVENNGASGAGDVTVRATSGVFKGIAHESRVVVRGDESVYAPYFEVEGSYGAGGENVSFGPSTSHFGSASGDGWNFEPCEISPEGDEILCSTSGRIRVTAAGHEAGLRISGYTVARLLGPWPDGSMASGGGVSLDASLLPERDKSIKLSGSVSGMRGDIDINGLRFSTNGERITFSGIHFAPAFGPGRLQVNLEGVEPNGSFDITSRVE